jgi:hypothetical protein
MADFTGEEIEFIEAHKKSIDKWVLRRFKDMKEKKTGVIEGYNCFCKKNNRKIWLKDFIEWYESVR